MKLGETNMRSVEKSAVPSLLLSACLFAGAGIASADTITQTTIMPGTSEVVVTQPDQVITSQKMMLVPSPSSSTTTTTKTVETLNSGLGEPKFDTRIQRLRDQVNKAISNGWISTSDAVVFSNRLNDLSAVQNTASSEVLEKQLNQINIDLSGKMNH
jgi:hypothetical protein